jgi:hypothetical protein
MVYCLGFGVQGFRRMVADAWLMDDGSRRLDQPELPASSMVYSSSASRGWTHFHRLTTRKPGSQAYGIAYRRS